MPAGDGDGGIHVDRQVRGEAMPEPPDAGRGHRPRRYPASPTPRSRLMRTTPARHNVGTPAHRPPLRPGTLRRVGSPTDATRTSSWSNCNRSMESTESAIARPQPAPDRASGTRSSVMSDSRDGSMWQAAKRWRADCCGSPSFSPSSSLRDSVRPTPRQCQHSIPFTVVSAGRSSDPCRCWSGRRAPAGRDPGVDPRDVTNADRAVRLHPYRPRYRSTQVRSRPRFRDATVGPKPSGADRR